jgi:hypothetical protein
MKNYTIMASQQITQDYLPPFEDWYKNLKIVKANEGPANGTMATALVVLEKLKNNYNLNFQDHLAKGGAQIQGVSGSTVADILIAFGEVRPFAKEGGRTNRGGPGEIKLLLDTLEKTEIKRLSKTQRNEILTGFQQYIINRIKDFHNRQRLKLLFTQSLSTRQIIFQLMEEAKNSGRAGPVAQHLVGAKLQLRFPGIKISNESFSTADKPTGREGDFIIGNTIFHVTVAPMPPVYEKCRQNVADGYRVYLLVLDSRLTAARQNAEDLCGKTIAVESIESFVSQNIEEIGAFASENIKKSIKRLFELYNTRIDEVEIDKSIMIEFPANLK